MSGVKSESLAVIPARQRTSQSDSHLDHVVLFTPEGKAPEVRPTSHVSRSTPPSAVVATSHHVADGTLIRTVPKVKIESRKSHPIPLPFPSSIFDKRDSSTPKAFGIDSLENVSPTPNFESSFVDESHAWGNSVLNSSALFDNPHKGF